MELTHTFTVSSSVATTWAHVMDLHAVGGCFPGATVTSFTGDDFAGTVKVKLGPIVLLYAGTGRFIERDDTAHVAVLEAKGKDSRGNGTAGATVTLRLTEVDGGTRAELVTELAVTGKPAQFGRGVMQDVSDKLLGQFVACLEHQLAGDFDEPRPAADSTPTAAAVGAIASADALAAATAPAADAPSSASPSAHVVGALARGNALAASAAMQPSTPQPSTPRSAEGLAGESAERPTPAAPGAPSAPAAAAARTGQPASRVGMGSASRPAYQPPADDAVDLGAAVLPVLAKTYGPDLLAGVVGLLVGVAIRRRPRR
jgi:carbon monoxide dehydrogenase subunit G